MIHRPSLPRRLALLLCSFCIAIGAVAQSHYDSRISMGVRAGYDLSKVFFNPSTHDTFHPGFTAGLMLQYIEENHFGLLAEANFVQRGWNEDFRGLPFNYSRTLNYAEIPVMAHIFFGRRGRFFFNVGPQVAFLISESEKANFNPSQMHEIDGFPTSGRRNDQITMPAHNKVDYGITAGLGGEFFINAHNSLRLEARFYYGLGNIFRSRRTDIFSTSNQMTISITAGYLFRFK